MYSTSGENFPSSLPSLRRATQMRSLPVLVVGAAMNGDIIPAEGNYKKFNSSCFGPFWEVDLLGAGHLSFLDKRDEMDPFTQMAAMLGKPPSTPEASVSAVTKVATIAWLKEVVCPYAAPSLGRTSSPPPPPPKELERVLYDNIVNIQLPDGKAPRRSDIRSLESRSAQGSSSAGGASESSRGDGASSSQGEGSRRVQASPAMASSSLCGLSREELLQLRTRELKENLKAAGVKNDDCFEKEQLVSRVLEACGKTA
uniref:Uncharacterized protein n=1 Tax=Dunaliella tertiolecta TaxID=3047 RepID=A0A7S3R2A2_DUNTE